MSDAKGLGPVVGWEKWWGHGLEFKACASPPGAGQTICLVIDMSRIRSLEKSEGRVRDTSQRKEMALRHFISGLPFF